MKNSKHIIQGIGYGFIPPHWDPNVCNDIISIDEHEVLLYKKLLAERESLHLGFSSAANVCAAVKLLQSEKLKKNAIIVTILCDNGLKY